MNAFAPAAILFLALYVGYGVVWRLWLCPIARFPGPRLAAVTGWYEIWFDLVRGGQYVFRIREMHERYGPIVRISPWELHINDPDFYPDLYSSSSARDKYAPLAHAFGGPLSTFGTVSHSLHRLRRSALAKFFSRASITRLEPLIQASLDSLFSRLETFKEEGKVVSMNLAWSCVTNDVVVGYTFGKSYGYVESAECFRTDIHEAMLNTGDMFHVFRTFPMLVHLLSALPRWFVSLVDKKTLSFLDFQKDVDSQIEGILSGEHDAYKDASHRTIFHEVLSSNLPASEKSAERLSQEGQVIVGAGTETTAWALTVATFHILNAPTIHSKLLLELKPLFESTDGKPNFNQLEQLPYLTGVVNEGLRLSYGVTTHTQRVSPDSVIRFNGWAIPPGTPVSMTSYLIHSDPSIFPFPGSFEPERWLGNPGLKKYLVTFGKGSRQCLGMNLANAEMYLGIAGLVWRFPEMGLVGASVEDVKMVADYFVPKSSGREIRVKL